MRLFKSRNAKVFSDFTYVGGIELKPSVSGFGYYDKVEVATSSEAELLDKLVEIAYEMHNAVINLAAEDSVDLNKVEVHSIFRDYDMFGDENGSGSRHSLADNRVFPYAAYNRHSTMFRWQRRLFRAEESLGRHDPETLYSKDSGFTVPHPEYDYTHPERVSFNPSLPDTDYFLPEHSAVKWEQEIMERVNQDKALQKEIRKLHR
jgi:hypothetical protein